MFDQFSYLYVEDDCLSQEIMQMIMHSAMDVKQLTIFENSDEFMLRLKSLPAKPDIIMLDIHLKPYDGFALLKMLRSDQDYQDARVIALTASVMNEEVDKLQRSRFDGAIAKPLSVQTFPGLMQRILDGESIWHIT